MTFLYGQVPVNRRRFWPASPINFRDPTVVGLGRNIGHSNKAVIREGHYFQEKVYQFLSNDNPLWFPLEEVEISYFAEGKAHKAYVDIVLVEPRSGYIVVIEAKRTHTSSSYRQLWVYMSLLHSRFPASKGWKVCGFEAARLAGKDLNYSGSCTWCYGPEVDLREFVWSGEGAPHVGILPFYINEKWEFRNGQ